ncbi:extracellular solute-binding protein [Streptomyces sp. NPDC051567]|uniref:extracellular solute-binding protein n=1 Tax=Streptomyces sp. NPDC051567 TaxID=3365660 RepID=UPI00379FF9FD
MKQQTVIDVWVPDLGFPGVTERWMRMGSEFESAHPEYRVNIVKRDFWSFPAKVAEGAAQGDVPAIAEYYFYVGEAARDARAQDGTPLFTSLEKAIAGRTEILGQPVVTGDLLPAFRDYYTIDGELASMPSVGTTMFLYANTDLLRAAGVHEMPQTWDEVTAACAKVALLEDGPEHAITWSNHGLFFQQAIANQGGTLVDQDNGRSGRATTVDLASKEILAWVEWWRGLHRDGHYLYTGVIPDWAGTLRAFAEQRVAFRISSSNDVNYMVQAAENGGFGIEVGRFPYNDHVPYVGNAVAGSSLWIAEGLDEATRDGALAFTQFLTTARNAADRHKENSFVPLTHASYALLESEGWFAKYPYHAVASEQVSSYPERVAEARGGELPTVPPVRGALFGNFAGIQDVMTRAMHDVLAEDADPAERFAAATVEAQQLLDAYEADCKDNGPSDPDLLRVEFFAERAAGRDYTAADMEDVVRLNR